MTAAIRKLITIIIIAISFMTMACTTPGDAALQNYNTPETPALLLRQPTDVPLVPYTD